MSTSIRVRFAPSPTGFLHVGGLRTALYNYLFAKKNGGSFILRIEDTDKGRFVDGALESLIRSLEGIGVVPDEGVFLLDDPHVTKRDASRHSEAYPGVSEVGSYGPYIQSERLPLYAEYAEKLITSGHAYRCFCSRERLDLIRERQIADHQASKYDKLCATLSNEEVARRMAAGEPSVIRLNVPEDRGDIVFHDLVKGDVCINAKNIDDQIIVKTDGYPTYHLASVVDDHLMEVTHVIRGEEWLPSTPKHILLYEAFGWEPPIFAHLTLLLNPDKSKLSKRQGDVAVEDYLTKGYLPEALINFVALLGWNPGQGSTKEVFSLSELAEVFDFAQVNKAGAVFDTRKLDWLNAQYIKAMTVEELTRKALPFLQKKTYFVSAPDERKTDDYLHRVVTIGQERLTVLSAIGDEHAFLFTEPDVDPSLLPWKGNSPVETAEALENAKRILSDVADSDWTRERLGEILLEAAGEKRGDFLWPLRVALSGVKQSPPPQDIAWVLGKKTTLFRISVAINMKEDVTI
ncbi:MAG: glutamate--tRNA ligase [Candidatus Moranbacteria bacterium]|nr:glutamate--tRNA ligase [Candidatus Moranbacteria bacterium]